MKTGIVVKVSGRWCWVECQPEGRIRCSVKGSFRLKGNRGTQPVVVGDRVHLHLDTKTNTGLISEILERRNYIIRKSSNLSREHQILAANIDQAILICTLTHPKTYLEFIDRFLVSAEAYRIPAFLVFNKTDLYSSKQIQYLKKLMEMYLDAGYRCLQTSARTGENIPDFLSLLKNKISLIAGNSGVGKSTLINLANPALKLKTQPVSRAHHAGLHTTTYSEMFPLDKGGYVIDTPGIKGFGLVDFEKTELYHFFPEIFRLSKACNYYNCTHTHEPGCVVKEAVARGDIGKSRYESYLKLFFEEDKKYRE